MKEWRKVISSYDDEIALITVIASDIVSLACIMVNRKTFEVASCVEELDNTGPVTHSTDVAIRDLLTYAYHTMWKTGAHDETLRVT
jgi:hypothetical protein